MRLPARFLGGMLGRFLVVYALVMAPWPGWKEMCASYLRGWAGLSVATQASPAEISVEAYHGDPPGVADTRIVIVNRYLMARDGSGPVRNLDLDLGRLATNSAGLLLALLAATPFGWRRRAWSAIFGMIALHGCILAFLRYCIWVESAEVALTSLQGVSREIATGFQQALIGQFGLAVPVLIWILVSFRRDDWRIFAAQKRHAGSEKTGLQARAPICG